MDTLAVLATLAFFTLSALYARALDQLGQRKP
jgi:hypothetical protein